MLIDFDSIKGIALDLDGTVYEGNQLIDGAKELINYLHEKNKTICYLTNSSTKTSEDILLKLSKLNVPLNNNELVITSAYATALYIKEKGYKNCYCLGSKSLFYELQNSGINLVNHDKVELVIIGLDLLFNYDKLVETINVIKKNNCPFIACNLDPNYPIENNQIGAGCGAIVSAIEYALDRKISYVVGKPNAFMLKLLSKRCNLKTEEILVIGDSYDSDIKMAIEANSPSILISKENNKEIKNCNQFSSLEEVTAYLKNPHK